MVSYNLDNLMDHPRRLRLRLDFAQDLLHWCWDCFHYPAYHCAKLHTAGGRDEHFQSLSNFPLLCPSGSGCDCDLVGRRQSVSSIPRLNLPPSLIYVAYLPFPLVSGSVGIHGAIIYRSFPSGCLFHRLWPRTWNDCRLRNLDPFQSRGNGLFSLTMS